MSRNKITQPSKKSNFNLIPDFEFANFKDVSVRISAKRLISKLLETGELDYLKHLASQELLYQEEIFWKQISYWKRLVALEDKYATKCLEALAAGFKACIMPQFVLNKKRGRPRKTFSIDPEELNKEYTEIQGNLTYTYGLFDSDIKQIKDHNKIINSQNIDTRTKRECEETISNIISNRIRKLTEFSKNDAIPFSNDVKKLAIKSTSEASLYILAKKHNVSIPTVKRRLAEIPRYEDIIKFPLPDGTEKQIPYDVVLQAELKTIEFFKKHDLPLEKDKQDELLADHLRLPVESAKLLGETGLLYNYCKLRTPRKINNLTKRSRKKTK